MAGLRPLAAVPAGQPFGLSAIALSLVVCVLGSILDRGARGLDVSAHTLDSVAAGKMNTEKQRNERNLPIRL
jgi:hypothetical protein